MPDQDSAPQPITPGEPAEASGILPMGPDDAGLRRVLAGGEAPYVTLKAAASLDGRIATRHGESQWITGEAARSHAHRLRASHQAVLAGIGTVLADDPRLTVRLPGLSAQGSPPRPQPARVVLDSLARTPLVARCLSDDGARRIVITGSNAPTARVALLRSRGVEVIACPGARPQPTDFLPALRRAGLESLLVEGGGQVHGAFIAQRAANELFLYIAPLIMGDAQAPPWCSGLNLALLAEAWRIRALAAHALAPDLLIHGLLMDGRTAD